MNEELINKLLETKIRAKIKRREIYEDEDTGEKIARFTTVVRDTHPIDFPVHPGEFVLKLHEKYPFAPLSPYYINLRNLPHELVLDLTQALTELKFAQKPDCVTGIPDGAVPFARKYSEITGIPYEDFLMKEDAHDQRCIISHQKTLTSPKQLLLIEDTITTGTSIREAVRVSEYLGYKIAGIAGIFDREQNGVPDLRNAGYDTKTVFRLTETLYHLSTNHLVSQKQCDNVLGYINIYNGGSDF